MKAFYSEISETSFKPIDLETLKILNIPSNESFKIFQLISTFQENPKEINEDSYKDFFPKDHSLKDLKRIDVAFGEQPFHQVYYDKINEIKKIDTLASDNLEQFLGYNALIPEGNNLPKKEKAIEDPFDQNFQQEEEKDQFSNLQIYWRFDEGKGLILNDLSDYEINGVLECEGEHDNDEIWIMLDDGDPLELEDKWGKKCPTQYGIDLNIVNLKNTKKLWFEEELKQFTIEFWLKPRVKNGMILEISNENFMCLLNDCILKLMIKGKPLILMEDEGLKEDTNNDDDFQQGNKNKEDNKRIKENFWNHVAIVYDNSQAKTIILYLNCFEIGYSNMILEPDFFNEKIINIGKAKFNGEITEFRLWKSANSLSEIKDSYRTPLEIVAEKKKKIKMKFKDKDKQQDGGKVDLKKFTGFLTMALPGVEPKEEKKSTKFHKPSETKTSVEEKPHEEDVQDFATYTLNLKPQNQFSEDKIQNDDVFRRSSISFVNNEEKNENKWDFSSNANNFATNSNNFATNTNNNAANANDSSSNTNSFATNTNNFATNSNNFAPNANDFSTNKNKSDEKKIEFGGFGEFSASKPVENNKSDWQTFEFGTNNTFSKKNENEENDIFSQRKISMPNKPENELLSDRNRTASLFEKYDTQFTKSSPESNIEKPFGNPFLKKKSVENETFPKFDEQFSTNDKPFAQDKNLFEKSADKKQEKPLVPITPMVCDYESIMQEISNVMEKSRSFMKEVKLFIIFF